MLGCQKTLLLDPSLQLSGGLWGVTRTLPAFVALVTFCFKSRFVFLSFLLNLFSNQTLKVKVDPHKATKLTEDNTTECEGFFLQLSCSDFSELFTLVKLSGSIITFFWDKQFSWLFIKILIQTNKWKIYLSPVSD